MKSRIIIGTIASALFIKQFISISNQSIKQFSDKLQFPYPYISESTNKIYQNQKSQKVQYRKNTWLLSFRNPQLFAEKFQDLSDNDLVLCETPKGDHVFKLVGAVSRNYAPFQNGVSNYIPPGFVFLVDPIKKEVGMENIAVITSRRHYSLGKFQAWWNKLTNSQQVVENNKKIQEGQSSLEKQILQRNNIRQQILQAKLNKKETTRDRE